MVNWRIYPNPVDDVCYIEFDNLTSLNGFLTLQDATGREIYRTDRLTFETGTQHLEISVRHLVKGVYFGHLELDGGFGHAFRVVR